MPRFPFCWLTAAVCLCALPALALEDVSVERALETAQRRLARTAASLPDPTYFPRSTRPDNSWLTKRNTDQIEWIQGFFPGCLWLLYDLTREPFWRARAEAWTSTLEGQKTSRATHDLGFKLMPSFGHKRRLTGDPASTAVLLTAASSLASRFNPQIGVIDAADWNPDWDVPTVVDTMMNLELLLWASEAGNRPELKAMALRHATKMYADMVRPDGGTIHVVDYDHVTGAIRGRKTYQGYADDSTWSRGQVWAMYGFTTVYQYTRDPLMLEAARKTTDYYLDHLPADFVPNWDFQAPTQVKDSSAAAAAASALFLLSQQIDDPVQGLRYRNAAFKTLESLVSTQYLNVDSANPAVLLHGVGHLPANQEIDVGLIYGDYYLLESLLRLDPRPTPAWYSRLDVATGLRTLPAAANGSGSRWEASFELTPLSGSGGELGYTDASAPITSSQGAALRLRLSDSGRIEAWDGDHYQALAPFVVAPGVTYRVRVRVDLSVQRYSVWVAAPGGDEAQIANAYALNAAAPPLSGLQRVLLKAGTADGDFKVGHHQLATSNPPEDSPPSGDGGNGGSGDRDKDDPGSPDEEEPQSSTEWLNDPGTGPVAPGGDSGCAAASQGGPSDSQKIAWVSALLAAIWVGAGARRLRRS